MWTEALSNGLLWARMQLLKQTHWRSFVRATQHPRETQEQLLLELVRRNQDTHFGRQHRFDRIRSYDDFRDSVPVQTYETLRSFVEVQEQTGEPALSAERPVMYAQTSGTTGKAKLIPILEHNVLQYKRSQHIQSYAQFAFDPRAYYGRLLGIASPATEGTLDSGRAYGSISGHMYKSMPRVARAKYVLPYQVFDITDYDLKYLVILRLAIAQPNITLVACANPSTLTRLLAVLDEHRTVLLNDVAEQRFHRVDDLSAEIRAAIEPRLGCAADRVNDLRTILGSPRPTFAQLWPGLRLVTTWTGGSCRIALAALRGALPSSAHVAELGYLSSELRGTITVDLERNLSAPTIHENFFEFVERDDWDNGRKVCRTVEQLEPGKHYYVIVTTSAGLYRYFMNDIVTVTGAFNATPTIQFVQKGKGVTNITGEKVYESQVIQAVRAAEDELGLSSAFFLMLADAKRAVYRLVVESTTSARTVPEQMVDSIEHKLGELNVEYATKRASGRLDRLELLVVAPGTGDAYKQHCVKRGQREGQFKLIALQYQDDCSFPFQEFRVTPEVEGAPT